jgi:hypothetical protein
MPLIFSFDHKHRKAPMEMKDLLGGKGANLAASATWFHRHHRCLQGIHEGWLAKDT